MHPTLKTIYERKSCRNYQEVKLPRDLLDMILQAGLQAPSSMNRQKAEITAVTNKQLLGELTLAIAKALGKPETYSCFYNAPNIVIISAPRDYSPLYTDGSCILQNIFLAATALDIGSCWINQLCGVEDNVEVRAILNRCHIPNDHLVCGCASLGYRQEAITPKEKNSKRIHIVE